MFFLKHGVYYVPSNSGRPDDLKCSLRSFTYCNLFCTEFSYSSAEAEMISTDIFNINKVSYCICAMCVLYDVSLVADGANYVIVVSVMWSLSFTSYSKDI